MKHISILLSVLLLAGLNIYADETAPKKVLTLKECVNIAVENNTSIKAAEEDRKKALADYRVATAQRLLSIDMNLKTDGYPKTNMQRLTHRIRARCCMKTNVIAFKYRRRSYRVAPASGFRVSLHCSRMIRVIRCPNCIRGSSATCAKALSWSMSMVVWKLPTNHSHGSAVTLPRL